MELLWLPLVAAWAWGSALVWAVGGGSQPVPGAVPSTLQNRVTWSEETRASLLYPYGREHGDQVLPAEDDGFSEELRLLEPFTLFGVPHRTAYVCTNGLVSFGEPVALFTPEAFPLETGQAFVAPFWADGSTSSVGHVWYRQSRRPELLQRAAGDLAAAFPRGPHSPRALLVATWDQIPFYGSLGSQVNTFQVVLVMGSGTSWALFLYNDIQWTTGVASGGSPHSGLGGIAAQAGFNSGRQGHYFSVPGSRTADILQVAGTSNVGVPGRWAFRTDAFAVPNGCAYSGQFLPLGATFWDSSACSHRCHCGQEGRVRCWPEGCQGGQQCAPAGPFARCQAPRGPTCRLGPQGHLHTLSGRQLRLQPCRFVLARLPGVRVDVELPGEAPEPAVLVQLLVHGQDLVVRSDGPPGHVLVNGHLRPLPLSIPEAGLAVHSWGSATRLATDTGLELWIQDGRLELTVPEAEVSITRGLCGPEALTPVGTPQLEPGSFQASWQEAGPCGSPWPSCPVHLRARYAGPEACGRLSALTGPFAACAWTMPVGPFVDACVEELCAAHGSLPVLCRALAAFVRACQAVDIPVGTWRGPGFCEPSCPENSHWETCADTCGARCPHEDEALACGGPCREGCVCDAGHLRSGRTCVHPAACGCPWQGGVLPLGAQELSPDCRELCQCRVAGRPPHCRPQACAAGTACLLRAGAWHCEARRGSSWVSGDPHYRTFDGAAFTAQGACRYVLSRTCRTLPGAPAFVVWVDNEYLSPAASVTGARQIEVDVHGVKVVMEALTPGRVQVNGTLAHLPLHLAGGLVHVYFSGSGAVLQTSAGLLVSYDWRRHVSVMVPETYAGALCGLGGDFNGDPLDDFRAPNGSLLHDPEAFALSWMDPASPAGCSITGPAPLCPHDREGRYQSLAFCGLLGARDGPFQACDEPAEARVHVENCVHDLCATGGSRQVLCEVLGSYAQQCQRHGLPVQPWRHLVDCEPACPPHSHYELCGSSCPSSCAEPALPDSCPTPCQEGCQCDAGFVLSGTDCVSPSQCGCSAGGRYHPAGEAFWAGERCERFCRCEASSHTVHCSPASCGPGQRCGSRGGIFGCHPLSPGTCHAAGHSHVITFDGRAVELPSTCASVFAESCGAPASLPFFRVELGKENRSHSPLTLISEVSIQVNGTQVHLQRASPGMAQVNGETTALPLSLAGGSLDVHWNGVSFVLLSDFGLWLSTDATYSLTLTVPRLYEGHTCGLCGSLAGPSEQHNGSCAGDCAAACAVCEDPGQIVAARRRCWLLREPRGPFGPCHAEVDPGPYMSSCVRDLCLAGGSDRILCSALQSYAAVCQGANVTLGDWRNSSFCAPQCPEHSRYQLCLDPSQARLCIPAPLPRLGGRPGCAEGCACDDAHLWARAECVPPEQCGCVHGGRVYQVGDLVWMSRCTRRCSCDAPGHFRCSPARCPAGEICAVRGGRLGCQSPLGTCVVTGDPHYFTFDGAITHFQGTCTYRLAHSCGPEPVPGGVSFSVEASNRNFRSHLVSFLYRVEVRLSSPGLTAHVILERGQQVQVDGQVVSLPVQLGAEARVWRQQGLVLLQVGTGLQVHFNGRHTLLVRVGPEHRGRLCGLCGNFNGDPGDDKVLPSGAPARSDADFGNAWQTQDNQPGCRQDTGDTQPCQDRPRVEQLCGVLTNRSGPFAECHWHEDPGSYLHACVFDLCQYGSGNRVLCAALESYAQLCSLRGVRLPEWRTSLGCSVACPANSYYDFCGPPCPATCASLNSSTPCTRQCTAGCFCLEGFALEGGVCVPLAHCGCHLQGRYLRLGAEVLPTATCDRKCVCRGPGRPLECRPHACRRRERCRQRQGVWGCHPMRYGTLWLYGDPHLHTLSGSHRQLRGPGRGALVRTCRPHHTPFAVWVEVARLEPWGAAWAQQVDVDVAGWRLSLLAGQFGVVQVNGSQAHLPLTLAGGTIRAFSTSSAITVRAATGLSVAFHESRALWVTVPDTYASTLCGLGVALGTDTWEDLGGPSGSWLPEAPDVAAGLGPLCPQDKAALFRAFCGLLGAREGPYAACSRDMDPRVHVENCVHDLCATGGSRDTLCAVLGSYAQECQRRGLPLQPWRHLVACEPACPPHSHYELCGSSCPSSCAEPALPDSCPTPCQEGCQCDAGFVLSGTDCVSPSQCGCSAGGRYHPAGETFWDGERCERFCRCEASSHTVHCSPASCGPGQRCGSRGGLFGCHPLSPGTCHAARHPGITTPDGRTTQCPGTSGFASSCAASCPQRFLQVELGGNSPGSPTVFISKLSFKVNGTHACLQTEVLSPGTTGNGCTEAQAATCTCPSISRPPSCPGSGAREHGLHHSSPAPLGLSVPTREARATAQPEAVSRRGMPAIPRPWAGPSSAPSLHARAIKPWNPK